MDAEGGRRITLGQTITRAVLVTLHGDRGFTPQLSDSCEVLASVNSQGVLWDRPWENLNWARTRYLLHRLCSNHTKLPRLDFSAPIA